MDFFTFLPAWAWLTVSALFYAGGEYFSEKLVLHPTWQNYAVLILLDVLSITSWLPALYEKNNLAVTGTLWLVFALVATALLGIFVFGQPVTAKTVFGIVLAVAVIILLS